jgi:hypothetical protein
MSKSEFYKDLIALYKKTGKGLTDTIKSKRKRINIWLKNQDHNVRIQSII